MPYIKRRDRERLSEEDSQPFNSGELNYLITRMIHDYIEARGVSYGALNEVIGVLECAKQEFYRRIVSPYEDIKMRENGDV